MTNPLKQFDEANIRNKEYQQFILSNKFEYGHDPDGGLKAGLKDRNRSQLNTHDKFKSSPYSATNNKMRDLE